MLSYRFRRPHNLLAATSCIRMLEPKGRRSFGNLRRLAVLAACGLVTQVVSVPQSGPNLVRAAGPAAALSVASTPNARIQPNYARLPLSFQANVGQTDPAVQFLARGPGYGLYLSGTEALMVLSQGPAVRRPASDIPPAVLHMHLLGGDPTAQGSGRGELRGKVHSFRGNDPAQWRTNIATFARVEYENVYPGINLVYYGNPDRLEYDFVVAPGADPQMIRLAFTGAQQISVDEHGDLVLDAGGQMIHWRKPVAYQEVNGMRQALAARFVLHAETNAGPSTSGELLGLIQPKAPPPASSGPDHQVGFKLASYDPTLPLVIDPVLSYATYLGGSAGDEGRGIAIDPNTGDILLAGSTTSTDFPSANPWQANASGGSDVFMTRLSADGSTLIYSTYLAGSGDDYGNGIAVDPSTGQALVAGATNSTDFPTANALQGKKGSDFDVFISRLSADGSSLIFSTYLGGSGAEYCNALAVDPSSGDALLTGTTASTDFPTANAVQPRKSTDFDAFVTRVRADGSGLVFSTFLGGNGGDYANGIAVDPTSGAVLVGGTTTSTNFPTANAWQAHTGGDYDAFITRLSADGQTLVFSTYLGGSAADYVNAIAVNPLTGDAVVLGATYSVDFPTVNAVQPQTAGNADAFVARLSADGSTLVFSTYLGGSGNEFSDGIAVDPTTGDVLVTGQTNSPDFPTANELQSYNAGGNDAYVTRLSADGSTLVLSTYLGGSFEEYGRSIAVDPSTGDALITGLTGSFDFPILNAFQPLIGGGNDAFVARISF